MEALGPILGGVGALGNLLGSFQQSQQLNKIKNIENLSPQRLAGKVSAATQPLNQGLVEGVQNVVQADMASRGLAQAPGIFAAEESQALAPYYQQNQNTALALIAQQLGIPEQTLMAMWGGRGMPNANISSLFQLPGTGVPGTPNWNPGSNTAAYNIPGYTTQQSTTPSFTNYGDQFNSNPGAFTGF